MPGSTVPGNANGPLVATGSSTLPSLRVTAVPATSPETVPSIDAVACQMTVTVLTESAALSTLPLPLTTRQAWPTGCVRTVTA